MSETVLVTGGAGFIGSHLCERLASGGHNVVVVDKQNGGVDIRNFEKMKQIFSKHRPDKVIHLASEVGVRPSIERPADYISTNVLGTQKVLELVRDFGVKQFIFASSSSVYGKRSGARGFRETDLLSSISPYAATKISAEKLCTVYATTYHIPTTILRFFTVYGPRNRPDMACFMFTDSIARGKPIKLFGKNIRRDFTFVTDVVEGVMLALDKPFAYEVFNLGNSHPETVLALVRLIEKNLHKKAIVYGGKLPLTDVPVTFANIDKAKNLLGWEPKIILRQGVGELVRWYNSVYA